MSGRYNMVQDAAVSSVKGKAASIFFFLNFNNTVKVYVMLGERESKNTGTKKTLAKNSNSQFTFVILFMWTCS